MVDEQTIRGLRGFYTWGGGDDIPAPANRRAKLRYKRFTMRDLWPEQNRFDWSSLDGEFDRAVRNGQLYALRLRDMVGDGAGVPEWVIQAGLTTSSTILDSNKPVVIPKYASAEYQALARQFIQAVADHCAARNPNLLAIVDIGMLGRYGEGHFWNIKGDGKLDGNKFWMPPIEAQRSIVDAHVAAFGDKAWLVCLTGPTDMLKYALLEAKAPRPIGWRRDSLGNGSFDDVAKNATVAQLLKDRAKIAPAITEFWNGTGDEFTPTRAREQAKRWGVWLIGNGNLGKEWKDYSASEQAEFLSMADDVCGVPTTTDPKPVPDSKPPVSETQKLAEVLTQVQALQAKVDALTTLLQSTNIAALQAKVDALTNLVQAVDVPMLHSKVDALAATVETRTAALSALVQQERRFVVETTIREVGETERAFE